MNSFHRSTAVPPQPAHKATSQAPEDAEVDAAERRVGGLLQDLEKDTGGEVKDVDVEEVVDTDKQGRPVLKKKVDIDMVPRKERHWMR